jgi:hypothetical protein
VWCARNHEHILRIAVILPLSRKTSRRKPA